MMKRIMIGAGLATLLATSVATSAMAQSYDPAWGTGNVLASPNQTENGQLMASPYAGSSESFAYSPRDRYDRERAARHHAHPHVMEGHSDTSPRY